MTNSKEFIKQSVKHLSARIQEDALLFSSIAEVLLKANEDVNTLLAAYMGSEEPEIPYLPGSMLEKVVEKHTEEIKPTIKKQSNGAKAAQEIELIIRAAKRSLTSTEIYDLMDVNTRPDKRSVGQLIRAGVKNGALKRIKRGSSVIGYVLNKDQVVKREVEAHTKPNMGISDHLVDHINSLVYSTTKEFVRDELLNAAQVKFPHANVDTIDNFIHRMKKKNPDTVIVKGKGANAVYKLTSRLDW